MRCYQIIGSFWPTVYAEAVDVAKHRVFCVAYCGIAIIEKMERHS
jgi:hypothetical protein